jgi:glutamyl-tRNA reductase
VSDTLLSAAVRLSDAPGELVEHLCGLSAAAVHERLGGGVLLLRTCERFEIYALSRAASPTDAAALVEALLAGAGGLVAASRDLVQIRRGAQAAEHLLRVSAGLDSRIVGEPQVAGQVRRAYLAAKEAGAIDAVLCALGRAAIHTGRRVARETTLRSSCRGLAQRVAALVAAGGAPRVGLIGSGHLAGELAQALSAAGAGRIAVCSGRDAAVFGYEDLPAMLGRCDVVIACTSRSCVLDEATVAAWASGSASRLVIDLGMPRNVAPGVGRLAGVSLLTLDDFLDAAADRDAAPGVLAAGRIVAEELRRFEVWRAARRLRSRMRAVAA